MIRHPMRRSTAQFSSVLVCVLSCASPFVCGQDGRSELPPGAVLQLIPSSGPDATNYQVLFSPSGRLLVTRDAEQVVRVWDMPDGRERYVLTGHVDRVTSIVFSPDERFLVTASPGPSESIHVWDLENGSLLYKIPEQPATLAMDSDGSLLVANTSGFVQYDLSSGHLRRSRKLFFPKRLTEVLKVNLQQNILAYVVSTQMRNVVPHEVSICDLRDGRILYHQTSSDDPSMVAIPPNGERAAICFRRKTDGVFLVDLNKDANPFAFGDQLPGHERETLVARFSRDSRVLATASWDGIVRLWDVLTGSQIATLVASSGHAQAVDFSPRGTWIVTAGSNQDEQTTLVWDMRQTVFEVGVGDRDADSPDDPAVLIQSLAARDVGEAYRAIGRLYALGDSGLEIARAFVQPMTNPLSDAEIDRLIADLDSDSFATREAAQGALLRIRRLATDRLTKAQRTAPSLEVELRLRKLLSTNENAAFVADSEYRQLYRLIQLLELFASEPAQALISELAAGHSDGRISKIAGDALQRLTARLASGPGA